MMKETTNGRHENMIPASAVYVPQPGGVAKPLIRCCPACPPSRLLR